ncbi:hypothetical protein G6F65_020892 [Rhizopus arrhizus]|nr:hypothetical protein G6F65_020892 [Rhizopus arrhizus]
MQGMMKQMKKGGMAKMMRAMGGMKGLGRGASPRHKPENAWVFSGLLDSRRGLRQGRDTQHLARVDLVGAGQHRLVGFENQRVLCALALAVLRLGDLPQVVALLHRVHLGFGRGLLHFQLIVHRGHADGVAQRQGDLLGRFGAEGFARHRDLVAIHRDLQAVRVQAVLIQLFLQLV